MALAYIISLYLYMYLYKIENIKKFILIDSAMVDIELYCNFKRGNKI